MKRAVHGVEQSKGAGGGGHQGTVAEDHSGETKVVKAIQNHELLGINADGFSAFLHRHADELVLIAKQRLVRAKLHPNDYDAPISNCELSEHDMSLKRWLRVEQLAHSTWIGTTDTTPFGMQTYTLKIETIANVAADKYKVRAEHAVYPDRPVAPHVAYKHSTFTDCSADLSIQPDGTVALVVDCVQGVTVQLRGQMDASLLKINGRVAHLEKGSNTYTDVGAFSCERTAASEPRESLDAAVRVFGKEDEEIGWLHLVIGYDLLVATQALCRRYHPHANGDRPSLAEIIDAEQQPSKKQAGKPKKRERWIKKSNCFLSWHMQAKLLNLADGMLFEEGAQATRPYYWSNLFAIRQVRAPQADDEDFEMFLATTFANAIESTKKTFLYCDDWREMSPLMRIWCVHEVKETIVAGGGLILMLPEAERNSIISTMAGHGSLHNLIAAMSRVDARNAVASRPGEAAMIKHQIEQGIGFSKTNSIVTENVLEWLADEAWIAAEEAYKDGDFRKYEIQCRVSGLHQHMNDHGKAAGLLEETLAECETHLGVEHALTINVVTALASSLGELNHLDEALQLGKRSLSWSTCRCGEQSAEVCNMMVLLSVLLAKKAEEEGCNEEGKPFLDESLELARRAFEYRQADDLLSDRTDPHFHDAQLALACALSLTEEDEAIKEAEHLAHGVVEMCKEAHGPRHPKVAGALTGLSKVLQGAGKLHEAVPLAREAVELTKELAGVEAALDSMSELMELLQESELLDEALVIGQELVPQMEQHRGRKDMQTVIVTGKFARVLHDAGEFAEGLRLIQGVVKTMQKKLGIGHEYTLSSMGLYIELLKDSGDSVQAEEVARELVKKVSKQFGKKHPTTIDNMGSLARLLGEVGKTDEAEKLASEVIALSRRALGPEEPDTLRYESLRAKVLQQAGKLDEAKAAIGALLPIMRRVNGADNEDTEQAAKIAFELELS